MTAPAPVVTSTPTIRAREVWTVTNPDDQLRAEVEAMVAGIAGVRTHEDGRLLGPVAAAARLCDTERSPGGVSASTYRHMMVDLDPPAPGPIPVRNPTTGKQEWDLIEVRTWHINRPEPSSWFTNTSHRTEARMKVLVAAGANQLETRIDGSALTVELYLDGQRLEGRGNVRAFTDMHRGGAIVVPQSGGGTVALSESGQKLLAQWRAEERQEASAARN